MIVEKKRVLGRGLESLIPAARTTTAAPAAAPMAEPAQGEKVQEIALEEIGASPYQPRRHHRDQAALEELAQSIRAQGVIQPIVVRYIPEVPSSELRVASGVPSPESRVASALTRDTDPSAAAGEIPHPVASNPEATRVGQPATAKIRYQLIAGERRVLASKMAGRKTVPAIVRPASNEQAMEMALIENLQREDLDCLEMAYAYERLSQEFKLTQEEMAKRTGKDRGTIANLLRLLKLPPEVRAALARKDLSFGHAKELMEIPDATVMTAAAQKIMREGLSVRQTEELVNHLIWLQGNPEPKREKKAPAEDPNVRAARMELEGRLGCRVKILDHQGKGKVVIEYKSLEDFDRIVEALGR